MARLKSWSRPHVSMSLKKVIQNILNYLFKLFMFHFCLFE